MNLIKQFFSFIREQKYFDDIELSEHDKIKLGSIDKELVRRVVEKSLYSLHKEMINGSVSREYVIGYKNGLYQMLSYVRKQNDNNNT